MHNFIKRQFLEIKILYIYVRLDKVVENLNPEQKSSGFSLYSVEFFFLIIYNIYVC